MFDSRIRHQFALIAQEIERIPAEDEAPCAIHGESTNRDPESLSNGVYIKGRFLVCDTSYESSILSAPANAHVTRVARDRSAKPNYAGSNPVMCSKFLLV